MTHNKAINAFNINLINSGVLKMKNVKLINVQNIVLNNRKVTIFDVYFLKDDTWVFDYNEYIYGWYKRESKILSKHIAFNAKY